LLPLLSVLVLETENMATYLPVIKMKQKSTITVGGVGLRVKNVVKVKTPGNTLKRRGAAF